MPSSIVIMVPTTTSAVRVTRLRKLPASVDQATMTLAGSSAALPVSARYSDFVRAPMGPIQRSSGHGAWKAEVSAALDVGESWNLGLFLAHALKAHGRLQEQQSDGSADTPLAVWATGAVDVIDLRILPVGHIETKLRQALGATPVPDLFLLPPDNLGDVAAELRADLEARGTRIIAPTTMAEALDALGLPSDWAKEAAPDLAGWRGDPYRGLEAYQAEHRPIFFGRSSARTEALERLRTRAERGTSLLVIHGKSGVGKSSLAMAGLLDDVLEQVAGRAPFGTATIRFGDGARPLATLRAGFAQALGRDDGGVQQVGSATEWLEIWPENTEPRTLLLILDQLEQALLADEADTIAFGEAIATLVRTGRVWVIATLRSDRIDLLERAPALAEMADGEALYRLVRPTLAELGEIIRAPAKLAGLTFEEGNGTDLVNLLAEEAMRAPDSLPLLQVTLMRLADQRDADGRVGMRDYDRIGGFSGAVGRLADATVRKIEADGVDGDLVDRTLVSLVRIDADTDRVDARVVDPDAETAEVQQVLSALVETRLATASTVSEALDPDTERRSVGSRGPKGSGRRVRLAHETLIREWPRLHDLTARLRSELSLRDRLDEDALRWDQDGRPKGDLIRNTVRLNAAEALIADGLATPSPQACSYIEASRAEVERLVEERQAAETKARRARARRRLTAAAVIVTAVILGLTGFAINQAQQTQAAEALAQAAEAAELLQVALTDEQRERALEAERLQAEANTQLELAREQRSIFLAESSMDALRRENNPEKALLLAIEALPPQSGNDFYSQPSVAVSAARLALDRPHPEETFRIPVDGISISPDGLSIYVHQGLRHDALISFSDEQSVSSEAGPGWSSMGWQRLASSIIDNRGVVFQLTETGDLRRDGRSFLETEIAFSPPYSPEGDYLHFDNSIGLIVAKDSDTILVVDQSTGQIIGSHSTEFDFIRYGVIPSKNVIFYISQDGSIRGVDGITFEPVWENNIGLLQSPNSLRLSYSGYGVAISNGRDVYIFEGSVGSATRFQTPSTSLELALAPDGENLARIDEKFFLTLTNRSGTDSIIDFGTQNAAPIELGFLHNGDYLVLLSRDNRLRVWSTEQNVPEFQVIAEIETGIGSGAHSWDRSKVVLTNSLAYQNREQVHIFDLEGLDLMWRSELFDRGYGFDRMAISNDGRTFIGASVCACEGFVVIKQRGTPSDYEVLQSGVDYSDDWTRALDAGFDRSQSSWFLSTTLDGA